MPLTIAGLFFPNKTQALRYAQTLLRAVRDDLSLLDQPLSGEALRFIAGCYARHPRRGILQAARGEPAYFCVAINTYQGGLPHPGFHAVYADGFHDVFSYRPCIDPAADAPSLTAAARGAVHQIHMRLLREAWDDCDRLACSLCPRAIEPDARGAEAAVIHHLDPAFAIILQRFVARFGRPVIVHSSADMGDTFADPGVMAQWVAFHEAHAVRSMAHAGCNLRAG